MAASLAAAAAVLMVSLAEIAAQSPMGGDMPIGMTLPETNLTIFRLPPPPKLEGALAPNNWLSKAVKYMAGSVVGPESMVVVNGHVYTGTSNGYVMHFHPSTRRPRNEYPRPCGKPWRRVRPILRLSYNTCGRGSNSEAICGRPLGIRAGSNGNLIVVDAYKGIFKINPRTCQYQMLVNAHNVNNQGDHLHFLNDVTVAKNGLIFFTSSSDKYPRPKYMNIILEGDKSGRVMVYNPKTKLVTDVMRNLHFPNGLQLAKDESYLLVAEGARAKIHRIWLKGNRKGQVTTFADNLPGFVDNIRLSPRGTYWVAISSVRYHGRPGVLDQYGPQPRVRQFILAMPLEQIMARSPKYGMVVELNANGQPIRSLHDPSGLLYDAVSEVEEEKGLLFFGSYKNNFIGVLRMRVLPPPVEPPTEPVTTQAPPPVVPPPTTNPQVNFLNHVQTTIAQMSKERLRQIIMVLVQRFLEARLDSRRAVERANRLQHLLNEATQVRPSGTTGHTITTEFSGADTATDTPTTVVPSSWA